MSNNNRRTTNTNSSTNSYEQKHNPTRPPHSITFSDDDSDEMFTEGYSSDENDDESTQAYDDSDYDVAPVFQTNGIQRNEPQQMRRQPPRNTYRNAMPRSPSPHQQAPPERIRQPVPRRRPQSPPPSRNERAFQTSFSDEDDVEEFINYVFSPRGDHDEFYQRLRNFFRIQLLNRIRGEALQRQSLIESGIDPRVADLVMEDRDFTDADYETLLLLDKNTKPKSTPTKVIESLKCRKIEKNDQLDICSICLTNFSVGDTARELKCKHIFHVECVDEWLKNYNHVCPICKKSVIE